jgi:hypothetical protein
MRIHVLLSWIMALAASSYIICSVWISSVAGYRIEGEELRTWSLGIAICHASAIMLSAMMLTGRRVDTLSMAGAGLISASSLWLGSQSINDDVLTVDSTAPWQAAAAAAAFLIYSLLVTLYLVLKGDLEGNDQRDKLMYAAWKRCDVHVSSLAWLVEPHMKHELHCQILTMMDGWQLVHISHTGLRCSLNVTRPKIIL